MERGWSYNIPKLVFSRALKNVEWKNVQLAQGDMKGEVFRLKQQPGKNTLLGQVPPFLLKLCSRGASTNISFVFGRLSWEMGSSFSKA